MEAPHDPGRAAAAVAGRAAAAACGVLGVAVVTFVVWRSAALLGVLYMAAILAVVLDRPVAALVRRGLPRGWALALVLTAVVAIALAAAVVALGPLLAQARELAAAAPDVADSLRAALVDRFGAALDGSPLATSFHDALSRSAAALAGGVYGAAGGVFSAAGALATVVVTAVLLLASGPGLVKRTIGALPARRRPWAEALARDLSSSLGGYLAGLGIIVVARVLATGAYLALARLPFAIPLALVAGASVLIPYLGALVRLLAIGAVAWAARGTGGALVSLGFVVAYDVVENYVLSPVVYRRTLGISALGQLVAVLFVGYHFGVIGALLAIPLAATVQVFSRSIPAAAVRAAAPRRPESRGGLGAAHPPPPRDAPASGRPGHSEGR